MQLIDEVDLSYPIILDQNGRVMDGMHHFCRLRVGRDTTQHQENEQQREQ